MSFKQFSTNQGADKTESSVKASPKPAEDKHEGMPEDKKETSAKS